MKKTSAFRDTIPALTHIGVAIRILLSAGIIAATLLLVPVTAAASFTVTPSTWNVIGLDGNTPAFGPNHFPVGAKVCSTTAVTNVDVTLVWDSANPYVDLRPGSANPVTIPSIGAGACADAYFEVEVAQNAFAFDTTRRYHMTAGGASTPVPRELYVEHLVSQGRNAITDMQFGTSLASLQSVPSGGSMDLLVGNTYYIRMYGYTATQGYEQLESFINMPNTVFQVLSVETTYTADTSAAVSSPNDKLYGDACSWENDPNSPNYRSCSTGGKVGGSIAVTYQVRILSVGSGSATLSSMIHDFSGSSFHYNSDYTTSARMAYLIDPSTVTIAKTFTPNPTDVGGVSTLTFTLTNPNGGAVSGVNFTDTFPVSPGTMLVATPLTYTTNGCGTPTFAPVAGAGSISFSNGTIGANSSCTVKVNVTPPATGTYSNTSSHLLIGTLDTCKSDNSNIGTCTASASLTVNSAPPPTPPVCNLTMASWTIPAGSANPPVATTKASDVATAKASAFLPGNTQIGNSGQGDTASWSTYGYKDAGQYIDFVVDTSKYTSVFMGFYVANASPANGPATLVLSYNNGAGFTTINTTNNPAAAFTLHSIDLTGLTSTTGNTTFRLTATGAKNNSSGASLDYDNITFSGCAVPVPLTMTKSFSPSPVAVNAASTLTFTVVNPNANIPLTGISFSDTLVSGLTVTTGSSTQCGGTLTRTSPSSISFSGGTLAAGSSCTITATVTATTAGSHVNVSGFVSSIQTGANTSATGVASASLTALLPPGIAKQFAPSPILSGGTSTLSLAITNPNENDALSGVAFTDTFPVSPGNMVVSTPAVFSTSGCGTPIFTPAAGAGSITFSAGTIAAGGTCSVTVKVTAPAIGTYNNTSGTVSHIINAATVNGNTASGSLTVNAGHPAIALLKQVGPAATGPWTSFLAVATGGSVYYKFTTENAGDAPLSPVSVTDPQVSTASCVWPATLPVAVASNDNHIATCIVGPVTAVAGSHVNTATASGTYSGTAYTDQSSATYATTDLSFSKNAQTYFSAAGDVLNYSYTLTNSGSAALVGPVTVSDNKAAVTCPAVSTVGDHDNYLDPAESITCTASYTVLAADVTAKRVTNTASATVGGVTSATASKTVLLAPDLTVVKANNVSGKAPVGSSFNWTLTVSNAVSAGTATFTNSQVLLIDDLPVSGATYTNPATATNAGGTTGTVDCTIASDTLTCSANGTVVLPPGGALSLPVKVDTSVAGSLVNPKSGGVCKADPNAVITEIDETNNDCADTVSVLTLPNIVVVKMSQTVSDPYNGATNPKAIPGAVVLYTATITNTGPGQAETVVFTDPLSGDLSFFAGDMAGPGSGPVLFTDGAIASGVAYTFSGLANAADSIAFSNDNGVTFGYTPVPDGSGFDSAVTHFRITFTGNFKGSSGGNNPSLSLMFKARVK